MLINQRVKQRFGLELRQLSLLRDPLPSDYGVPGFLGELLLW
jgi:hypothetical protein